MVTEKLLILALKVKTLAKKSTKEIGSLIKCMAKVDILLLQVLSTKALGQKV